MTGCILPDMMVVPSTEAAKREGAPELFKFGHRTPTEVDLRFYGWWQRFPPMSAAIPPSSGGVVGGVDLKRADLLHAHYGVGAETFSTNASVKLQWRVGKYTLPFP